MSSWYAFLCSVCLLGVFWALGEHKAKARHLLVLDFYLVLARLCLPGVERLFCSAALDNGAANRERQGGTGILTFDDYD